MSRPNTASARSAGARLAGSPPSAHPGRLPPVPLVLALVLGCLLLVMLSGAHLASAARLTPWLDASPVRALSPSQTGKLLVFAGLAALTSGILLLLRQWPQVAADRTLTMRFAWLLLSGGGLVAALDLARNFGLDWSGLALAEEVVKWAVFGGCGALLGWRLLGESGGLPPDQAAD